MRIRYTVPFKRNVIIDDHWDTVMQGGKLRVVENDGYATGLELIFERQPVHYAPDVRHHTAGDAAMTITGRDLRMPFVKRQLDDAAKFLGCFFDIELSTDEIEARYEGETPEEEAQISIKSSAMGRQNSALLLPFDMLTRAIMVAERQDGPRFESTLAGTARKALTRHEFINSFRYSFLLIEALYGGGQFKKEGLQGALKGNQQFRNFVDAAIRASVTAATGQTSDTAKLLAADPTVDDFIDHLVEKRGFYFHGNVRRKNAWQPDEQGEAASLALIAFDIASQISAAAADEIFQPEFVSRHAAGAKSVGAEIVFQIDLRFREPEETFDRTRQVEITAPGTKLTPRTALSVAQHTLELFQEAHPVSALVSASCAMKETGQKVFEIRFEQQNAVPDKT